MSISSTRADVVGELEAHAASVLCPAPLRDTPQLRQQCQTHQLAHMKGRPQTQTAQRH